jgi:hypothetical protein
MLLSSHNSKLYPKHSRFPSFIHARRGKNWRQLRMKQAKPASQPASHAGTDVSQPDSSGCGNPKPTPARRRPPTGKAHLVSPSKALSSSWDPSPGRSSLQDARSVDGAGYARGCVTRAQGIHGLRSSALLCSAMQRCMHIYRSRWLSLSLPPCAVGRTRALRVCVCRAAIERARRILILLTSDLT